MNHRVKTKLLLSKVSEILLKEWHPFAIQKVPESENKYNPYIFSVCEFIAVGESEKIFNFLWTVETKHLGLPGNEQHTKEITKKLTSILETL